MRRRRRGAAGHTRGAALCAGIADVLPRPLVVAFAVGVTVAGLVASPRLDAARSADLGQGGRIAFASAWTENLTAEIYRLDLANGKRIDLTRDAAIDNGAVVSPDGTKILFRSSRDDARGIWVMDEAGADQRRVVVGESPSWSPDGSRIAFVDGQRRVATMAADGSDVRPIAPGRLPAWSPDGRTVAYLTTGPDSGENVTVAGADGTAPRRLFSASRILSAISWSPDGTRLALQAERSTGSGGDSAPAIIAVPLEGAARPLTNGAADAEPSWSPDGGRIAFVRAGRIFTVAATSGAVTPLTRPPTGLTDARPTWSPNGSRLVFARGRGRPRELFVVAAGGGPARRVRREDVHAEIQPDDLISWTSDGRSVIYSSQLVDNDRDIYTVEPDGSRLKRLTANDVSEYAPAYSPDGRWIAFVRELHYGREEVNEELFVMRADGSHVRRLTYWRSEDLDPAWSPDGSRILFVRRTRGVDALLSLYTIEPDGTGLHRLRTPGAFYGWPTWSPDGRAIALTTDGLDAGGVQLGGTVIRVRADGSRERALTAGEAVDTAPDWSPRGDVLSFARQECDECGTQVWTVRPDGTNERPMPVESAWDGAWSPDGLHLALLGVPIRIVTSAGRIERQLGGRAGLVVAAESGESFTGGISWQPRCTKTGSTGADRLRGGGAPDRLCSQAGDDVIAGGGGRDQLFGQEGNDSIDARDHAFDIVGCGPGRDDVLADRIDLVGVDCERVARA